MLRNFKRKHPFLRDVILVAEVGVIYTKIAFRWAESKLPAAALSAGTYRLYKGW